ncbi:hypothetical protein HYY70_02860 [Candidatus Woesearchaeota archaeon]|nr:hypothetical protein [Candidatus Woesearchaeota archaeon]
MKFKTINPATEEIIAEYELMPKEKVLDAAKKSHDVFQEWKQQTHHEKTHGINFNNPDFIKYAESFGAKRYRVNNADEFSRILKKSLNEHTVSIIDVPVDYSENFELMRKLGQEICPF